MILTANPHKSLAQPSAIPSMQVPIVKSGIFHLLIIGALTVGIPFVKKDPITISPPISVEIVDISELTMTNKVAPPAKPKEDKPPEPAQKKEASPTVTSEKPPELSKPAPPDVSTAESTPDVPPPPKPLERKPIEKPKPPEPKPEVTKKEEPKPKEKVKEKPKEEPKPAQDDFQSLLKNLTPEEDKPVEGEKALDPDATPDAGQIAKLGDQLTISEQDAVRRQLSGCWYVQAGAKYAEELIVEVRVEMNRDRTVNRAAILDQSRYNRETHFRAAADAALRALRNPNCSPLKLPPDKYDQWKTFVIGFDPRNML